MAGRTPLNCRLAHCRCVAKCKSVESSIEKQTVAGKNAVAATADSLLGGPLPRPMLLC